MLKLLKSLTRKKKIGIDVGDASLSRCLSTLDLTMLGVGATLGVGIYVLAGEVARDTAGPAVLISFFIAGIASFFSAICYAELGWNIYLSTIIILCFMFQVPEFPCVAQLMFTHM